MQSLYQLDRQSAPWNKFCYTIKNKDIPLYQIRRSGFRKYRQFEDVNNKILFYIGVRTIKSIDTEQTLANMQIDGKTIETTIGKFTLNHLDISQRSYTLKLNNKIVAQVKSKCRLKHNQYIIEMNDITEQYQAFIFALVILIDSILETPQSLIIYPYTIHTSKSPSNDKSLQSHDSYYSCYARSFLLSNTNLLPYVLKNY